ncbi:MAG: ABC transporter ATP-binding protein [Firmicutes bacterium]|nr:ABC transporter ATP-binding protein [Bacillota bacterium]
MISEDIRLTYYGDEGETFVLDGIDFSVEEGEFLSIVGPSGCGKSTLLSIIAGLLPPTDGKLYMPEKERMGYMLQQDHLFPWRTLRQNVLLGLEIQNLLTEENAAYADALLEQYGLSEFRDKRPGELSGGMRQRAALIRTLAIRPSLLLLDEPFSALDYQTRLYVSDDIGSIIKKEGKTAILVTHDISEAIALSDRVLVLSGRPARVKAEFKIDFGSPRPGPIEARDDPGFKDYFNAIWKELDINV